MENVALVTLLLLVQYQAYVIMAGLARGKANVVAPKMVGDENFERKLRIQLNTLESLIITLPAMWICAQFFSANVAAILGLVYFVGRLLYAINYAKDPTKRGPSVILGLLAIVGMIGCSLYGILF